MAEGKQVEIGAKLVFDASALEVLSKLQDELAKTSAMQQRLQTDFARAATAQQQSLGVMAQAQARAASGLGSFGKQFAATFLAVNLMPMVHQVTGLARSVFSVAEAEQTALRASTGLITGIQGVPWAEAARQASALDEQLDNVALSSGQLMGDVASGFNMMVEFMGSSKQAFDVARSSIDEIALVSQKMGKNVQQIGVDFGMMAQGMIRPRSELFNLLKTTGIFGRNVREAREQWSKLTEAERIKRLVTGIEQVSKNLKDTEPTFRDLMNTFTNIKSLAIEEFGKGIMEQVMPGLKGLAGNVDAHREEIKKYAQTLGKDVGKWVREAVEIAREAFAYIETHAQEIRAAITEGFEYAKKVIDFIIDNKEVLAIALGAKVVASVGGGLPGLGAAARGVAGVARAGAAGTAVMGTQLAGAAGGAAALGALALAIGGVSAAAWQAAKLYKETGGGLTDAEQDMNAIVLKWAKMSKDARQFSDADLKQMDHEKARYMQLAQARGDDTRAAGMYLESLARQHTSLRNIVGPLEESGAAVARFQRSLGQGGEFSYEGMSEQQAFINNLTREFEGAIASGQTGLAQYIAGIIGGSKELQEAFLQSNNLTAEGLKTFADNLTANFTDFKKVLVDQSMSMGKPDKGEVPKASVNFNGGQTFKIQQDFRDADPDRIAIVFQRDVAKSAMRRLQASTAPGLTS